MPVSAEPELGNAGSPGPGNATRGGQSTRGAPAESALDPRFVARFLAGMAPEVAVRFDARLLFAVQQAFGPRGGQERHQGWQWRLPFRWRGRRWRLSLTPLDDYPPADRRAQALRAARWRGIAWGLLLALVLAGVALLMRLPNAP